MTEEHSKLQNDLMTSLKTLQTSIAWTMLHRTKKNTLTGLPKFSYLVQVFHIVWGVLRSHPPTWKLEHRHGPTISITIFFLELLRKVQLPKGWGGRVPGVHYKTACAWFVENLWNGDTILAAYIHRNIISSWWKMWFMRCGKFKTSSPELIIVNFSEELQVKYIVKVKDSVFDPRAFGDEIINTTTFLLKLWKLRLV